MTETKITKAMSIESLLMREDLKDFEKNYLEHELELLKKKSSYRSKEDKRKAEENKKLETIIVDILTASKSKLTCSQIAVECSKKVNSNFTPQRITPRLSVLISEKCIEKVAEKGVNLYKVAE